MDNATVSELYDRGAYLTAWEGCRDIWEHWRGSDRLAAARLASRLGSNELRWRWQMSAWREDPSHLGCRVYRVRTFLERRGPLAAWELWRTGPDPDAASSLHDIGDWWVTGMNLALTWRDFATAESFLSRALAAAPRDAWILTNRAHVASGRDQREEAIALLRDTLDAHPHYAPAVQPLASMLHAEGRHEAALAILIATANATEGADVCYQIGLWMERSGDAASALAWIDKGCERQPLADAKALRWLAARRSDILWRLGRRDEAIAAAEASASPFHSALAERARSRGRLMGRCELDLPVIVQDHRTCAPASLAMIARFHGVGAEHRAVADDICGDGTEHFRSRRWAEDAGFAAREFTVDEPTIRMLIDRRLPFVLSTSGSEMGHAQVVMGYDEDRGTMLIRDPGTPYATEAAMGLLDDQAPWGVRGLVFAPAELLSGLVLPDAERWDLLSMVHSALARHDRASAAEAASRLRTEHGDSLQTIFAERDLAWYDGDKRLMLSVARRLRQRFPACTSYLLMELQGLQHIGTQAERLQLLEAQAGADPVLLRARAIELSSDGRRVGEAEAMVRRYLRQRPNDAQALRILDDLLWARQDRIAARAIARFAACAESWHGHHARRYAERCWWTGESSLGEDFLRQRCKGRLGEQAEPHQTLAEYLGAHARDHEAQACLETGVAQARDDQRGWLLLDLARWHARWNQPAAARDALDKARPLVTPGAWRATAAQLADWAGDDAAARGHWQAQLDADPFDIAAHRAMAGLLARRDGPAAALAHLDRAAARMPHSIAIAETQLDWLRSLGDAKRRVEACRLFVARHPDNAWGFRELGFACLEAGAIAEAADALAQVRSREPDAPATFNLAGDVAFADGRTEAAGASWMAAIAADPDNTYALGRRLAASQPDEAREALIAVAGILARSTTGGDGIFAWQEHADRFLEPEQVDAVLEAAHRQRPDLWQTWVASATHHRMRGRRDAAADLLRRAEALFPLVPRIRLERSSCEPERRREHLEQAVALSPEWHYASRQLAQAHEDAGDDAAAEALYRRVISLHPRDPANYAILGTLLRRIGRIPEGLDLLAHAAQLASDYAWAWSQLIAADPGRARALARTLIDARPGDADAWLRLADALVDAEASEDRFAALQRAAMLAPRREDIHAKRAAALAECQRWDEALAACAPSELTPTPTGLRRQAAIIRRKRGDTAGAITALRAILDDDPRDQMAGAELCETLLESGDLDAARIAADQLIERHPAWAPAYGHRLDMKQRAGDIDGALADCDRALELDPAYVYAANVGFDLAYKRMRMSAARTYLTVAERNDPGGWTTIRALKLAIADSDFPGIRRLLLALDEDDHKARWAWDAFEPRLANVWEASLAERFVTRIPCLVHASAWAQLITARCSGRQLKRELRGIAHAALPRLAGSVVERLAMIGKSRLAMQIIREHDAALRSDDDAWGSVGYACARCGHDAQAIAWLGDYRVRRSIRPWMLSNLSDALHRQSRHAEAEAVEAHALTLPPDHTTDGMRSWLAVAAGLAGDAARARALLDEPTSSELDGGVKIIRDLAAVLIELDPATAGRSWRMLADVHRRLATHATPQIRRNFRRVVWKIARVGRFGPSHLIRALWYSR